MTKKMSQIEYARTEAEKYPGGRPYIVDNAGLYELLLENAQLKARLQKTGTAVEQLNENFKRYDEGAGKGAFGLSFLANVRHYGKLAAQFIEGK
jgi:hypothetical protein